MTTTEIDIPADYQRLRRHDAIMTERVLDLERQIDDLKRRASPPLPAQCQWVAIADRLPDADLSVMLALDDGEVWPGYLDGDTWRYVTSDPIGARVMYWMDFPEPPAA
jgi:hypothetical protein